jgi:acetoin utilization protein AcuB
MRDDDSVEQAALAMVNNHFGGLPIVDEENSVVGIITDSDIFKVFIKITGAMSGGLQLAFELPLRAGSLREVLGALREHDARVISVLTSQKDDENRLVYIRVHDMEMMAQKALIADMQKRFKLLYWHPRAQSGYE